MRQQIDLPAALGNDFAASPDVRRLLGYDVPQPRSVTEYLAGRAPKS